METTFFCGKRSKEHFKRGWKTLGGRKNTSKESKLVMKNSERTEKDSRRAWPTVFGNKRRIWERFIDENKKILVKLKDVH